MHQGGIETTAQAMRSGRPALVVPFGHDQFDNAARTARIGVAETIYRSRYNAPRVAAHLRRLLGEPRYANASEELGRQVRAENGAAAADHAIEGMVSRG